MTKKTLLAALLVCISTSAMAADGPYFGVNLGITLPTDSDVTEAGYPGATAAYDNGFAFGASLGRKMGSGRLEAELGYKSFDLNQISVNGFGSANVDGNASVLSLMGNGYFDFDTSSAVKPFVMGGLGFAKISLDSTDLDANEDDTVFAFQLGVGLGFAVNETTTLDIAYRYMGTTEADFTGTKVTYGSNNFLAGIRVAF